MPITLRSIAVQALNTPGHRRSSPAPASAPTSWPEIAVYVILYRRRSVAVPQPIPVRGPVPPVCAGTGGLSVADEPLHRPPLAGHRCL